MTRLKIGARAHDLTDQTPEGLVAQAHQAGIDGLQLAVHKSWTEAWSVGDIDTIIANIQRLQQAGISIFLLASYFNPAHSDTDFLTRELVRVRINISLARRCNIGVVGSETGSLNDNDWTWHPENHSVAAFNKVEHTLAQLQPNLAQANCDFLVEAVRDHIIHDANSLARLNTQLGEHFKVTCDLANLLNADNAGNWREIFADFLNQHGECIRLFHFKNFILKGQEKIAVGLEHGLINYAEVLAMMEQHQLIDVPVIVEELTGELLFESVAYLRRLSQ